MDEEEAVGLEVDDSGSDSAPEVSGEEGRGEAWQRIGQYSQENFQSAKQHGET
jgi:hypothetical protein